ELDPVSVVYNRNLAVSLYFARRYDEAIEQCEKTLKLDPNMATVYNWLSRAYEQKKLYDQAVEAYLKFWNPALPQWSVSDNEKYGPEGEPALRDAYRTPGWE